MEWILERFQLIVIVVVAFVYWVKGRLEAKMAERQMQEQPPDEEDFFGSEEYSDQQDGMPPIPPPQEPRYRETVASEAAAARKHRRKPSARTPQAKATTTGGAAATRARVTAKGVKKAAVAVPASYRSRLGDPAEVRRAVVMREILGPPAGLR